MGQILKDAAPALAGHGIGEDERADMVLDIGVEDGFVVAAFLDGMLELAAEVLVDAIVAAVAGSRHGERVEIAGVARADGLIEDGAVAEDIAEGASGAVEGLAPVFGVVRIKGPGHVAGQPLLEGGRKGGIGARGDFEIIAGADDGPVEMAFERVNEENVRGYAPLGVILGNDLG